MRNYEIMFIVNPNCDWKRRSTRSTARSKARHCRRRGRSTRSKRWANAGLPTTSRSSGKVSTSCSRSAANGDIIKECERRLRVMDAVIKYLTVRMDEDDPPDWTKSQLSAEARRAPRFTRGASADVPSLQKRQCNEISERGKRPAGQKQYYRRKKVCKFCVERIDYHQLQRREAAFAVCSRTREDHAATYFRRVFASISAD